MEKDIYKFIPAAGPPTVKKLQKITLIFIGVITVGCGAAAIFSKPKPGQLIFIFCVYIILCLFVIAARYTVRYIVDIRIDPNEGMLYSSFMTHKGEMGLTRVDINQAKYSYKLRVTRGYVGYILTLKDKDSTFQVNETKSHNKNLTNVFFRSQLDAMNELILKIKEQNQIAPVGIENKSE